MTFKKQNMRDHIYFTLRLLYRSKMLVNYFIFKPPTLLINTCINIFLQRQFFWKYKILVFTGTWLSVKSKFCAHHVVLKQNSILHITYRCKTLWYNKTIKLFNLHGSLAVGRNKVTASYITRVIIIKIRDGYITFETRCVW